MWAWGTRARGDWEWRSPHQDAANSSNAVTRYVTSAHFTLRCEGLMVAVVFARGAAMEAVPFSWRKCFSFAYGICRKIVASSLSEWLVSFLSRLSLLLAYETLKSFLEGVYGYEFGQHIDSMKASPETPRPRVPRAALRPPQSVTLKRDFSVPIHAAAVAKLEHKGDISSGFLWCLFPCSFTTNSVILSHTCSQENTFVVCTVLLPIGVGEVPY